LLSRRIQTKASLNGLLRCPALRGHGCGSGLIRRGKPAHGSNAKLLRQGRHCAGHGLLSLGYRLASPVGGSLLPGLAVLDLTRRVSCRGACDVLCASGGLLESARLRLANIQTAKHGLTGNVLRRNARGSEAFLGGAHLTGDRALSSQHVLTANVSKGPCAESRFREACQRAPCMTPLSCCAAPPRLSPAAVR
jgi:hypothetical protein